MSDKKTVSKRKMEEEKEIKSIQRESERMINIKKGEKRKRKGKRK